MFLLTTLLTHLDKDHFQGGGGGGGWGGGNVHHNWKPFCAV